MNQSAGRGRAVGGSVNELNLAGLADSVVLAAVLVAKSVSSNDDGVSPARDKSGNIVNDDGLSEDSTIKDIADGTVRTLPHLF